MAKVELKQPIVEEIAELFDGAQGAVLVDYRGLTVEQDTIGCFNSTFAMNGLPPILV